MARAFFDFKPVSYTHLIGTIGIIASKKAGNVIGVELNQDAVRDAINNAKMNQISNIHFFCNDAGRFLVNMAEAGEGSAEIICLQSAGSGNQFITTFSAIKDAGEHIHIFCPVFSPWKIDVYKRQIL